MTATMALGLATAAVGFLLPTFGFPLLSAAAARLLRARRTRIPSSPALAAQPLKLHIVVPAYEEGARLLQTLQSIDKAAAEASVFEIRLTVALDGPRDATPAIAESFRPSSPAIRYEILWPHRDRANRGKWRTLMEAIQATAHADWVALVDAGTLWSPGLLEAMHTEMLIPASDGRAISGLAPGYRDHSDHTRPPSPLWRLESTLKRIENSAGGPVAVHGATAFYRREALAAALRTLEEWDPEFTTRDYLNDDVVLALCVRAHGEIRYLGPRVCVSDCGAKSTPAQDRTRRHRMMAGNLQWISVLLPRLARSQPLAALVALRRVARLAWVYCLALGLFGLGGYLGLGAAALLLAPFSPLAGAARASLLSAVHVARSWTRAAPASVSWR